MKLSSRLLVCLCLLSFLLPGRAQTAPPAVSPAQSEELQPKFFIWGILLNVAFKFAMAAFTEWRQSKLTADLSNPINYKKLLLNSAKASLVSTLGGGVGKDAVPGHPGSLVEEPGLDCEHRLERRELKALVATARRELAIVTGDVDLVCQLGSPRSTAALLQRVGRAGHHVGGVPKGRLFPQSREDLVECAALLD